jgi:hypothetical protein
MTKGPITKYLFANRCFHCNSIIEKVKDDSWFHSLNMSPYCSSSDTKAEPK